MSFSRFFILDMLFRVLDFVLFDTVFMLLLVWFVFFSLFRLLLVCLEVLLILLNVLVVIFLSLISCICFVLIFNNCFFNKFFWYIVRFFE